VQHNRTKTGATKLKYPVIKWSLFGRSLNDLRSSDRI